MGDFTIHTNIALDYPTMWTGSIYKEKNIKKLFNSDRFIEKILSGDIVGTVGFKKIQKVPNRLISHVVVDAYISEAKEIIFDIKTMDNKPGKMLETMLLHNPKGYLAKIIASIDINKSDNGVQHIIDIKYVHIDEA